MIKLRKKKLQNAKNYKKSFCKNLLIKPENNINFFKPENESSLFLLLIIIQISGYKLIKFCCNID